MPPVILSWLVGSDGLDLNLVIRYGVEVAICGSTVTLVFSLKFILLNLIRELGRREAVPPKALLSDDYFYSSHLLLMGAYGVVN